MSSQAGGGTGRFTNVRRHKSGGHHATNNSTTSNINDTSKTRKSNPNRNKSFSGPSRSSHNEPMNDKSDKSDTDDGFARVTRRNNNNQNSNWSAANKRAQGFQRPRPQHTQSFGAHKSGRQSNNTNTNNNNKSKSPNKRNARPAATSSFNRPRPTGSFNLNAGGGGNKQSFKRANSRISAHDVDLYEPGDGKSRAQRNVLRISAGNLLRCRMSYVDPPAVIREEEFHPHHKCLWTEEPTRVEQITAQMAREAFVTLLKDVASATKRRPRRILSSKLGDPSAAMDIALEDSVADLSENSTMRDESNTARSSGDDDIDNPLRQIMMLLNKLSWTTIGKLTTQLIQILESVPEPKSVLSPAATPSKVLAAEKKQEGDGSESPPTNDASSKDTTATNVAAFDKSQAELNYSPQTPGDNGKTIPDSKPQQQPQLNPIVKTILTQIVEKAQTEPHFSAMYAHLCQQLADRNTMWKKSILVMCQQEFEKDIDFLTQQLDESLDRKYNAMEATADNKALKQEERKYELLQLRKRYLGHIRFIGELFKLKMIKLDILIWCLARLLFAKDNSTSTDEDDLECFAKLMTTVGEQADNMVQKGKCHAKAAEKWSECWDRAKLLAGRTKPDHTASKTSSRMKFMFEDLLELKDNGWVERRQTETPKTIAEIHQEVKDEEAAAIQRSSSAGWFNRARSNSGDSFLRRRTNSKDYNNTPSPHSRKTYIKPQSNAPQIPLKMGSAEKQALMRRTQSDVLNNSSHHMREKKDTALPAPPSPGSKDTVQQIGGSNATPKITEEFLGPEDCKEKTKTILKEYFVGGDIQEAIRSIDELVAVGKGGSSKPDHGALDRGAAVVESGVLLVMEMKQQEVQKFLAVTKRCLQNEKLPKESLPVGLKDPLEFLSDIEIDAPMARSLLTSIVGYWMSQDALPLGFLLDAPEYFRTNGKAAPFAAGVVKVRGGDVTEKDLEVIEKLMTADDKKQHPTAQSLMDAQK